MKPHTPMNAFIRAIRIIALSLLAITASTAFPMSTSVPPPGIPERLREVGHGELTWLGFHIYEASLWSPDGRFTTFEPNRPIALSLSYQRAFSRAELVKITRDEWARLSLADAATRVRWTEELERCWHDVKPGDRITVVVTPGVSTRFFSGTALLGTIDDPSFGPAYLSIWLDPRTAVADLRKKLLGSNAQKAS
jgi:Chalcone isomerase-like